MDALSASFKAINIGPELMDDLRSLLNLTDAALSNVIQSKILEGLRFKRMNERHENIENAHAATFEWLLDESVQSEENLRRQKISESSGGDAPTSTQKYEIEFARKNDALRREARQTFVSWLANGTDIFHISGKPGAGKSTLMKYLCHHARTEECLKTWSGDKELVFTSFFFWRHGDEFQKSFKGLLRSLLHSILAQCPELIESTFPLQWEKARLDMAVHFEAPDIQDAFEAIIQRPEIFNRHKFAFFIDGLDEFEGREDRLVRALFSWVRSRAGDLKICASSRELPIFQERFSTCPKFRLHELTQADITIFVEDTLRGNEDVQALASSKDFANLGRSIVAKAEGVFLWVSLAVKTVEQGILADDRMEDLERKIDFLPSEVEELFHVIFGSIEKSHPIDFQRAMKTLLIVLKSNLRQSLFRLSVLEDFESNPNFAASPSAPLSVEEIEAQLRRCQKQVGARCRGFLNVISSHHPAGDPFRREWVDLTHRSLVEFFERPGIWAKVEKHSKGLDVAEFSCWSLVAELEAYATLLSPKSGPPSRPNSIRSDQTRSYGITPPQEYFEKEIIYDWSRLLQDCVAMNCSMLTLRATAHRIAQVSIRCTSRSVSTEIYIPCSWDDGRIRGNCTRKIASHPCSTLIMQAANMGYCELWPPSEPPDDANEHKHRFDIKDALELFLENLLYSREHEYEASIDNVSKSLAFCLHYGEKPDNPAYRGFAYHDTPSGREVTYWRLLLWDCIQRPILKLAPTPIFLVCLLYGADPHCWLRFDINHGFNKFEGLVSVAAQFGLNKSAPFSPIFIPNEPNGILDLAKRSGWSVSLRDLVGYWFSDDGAKVQHVIDFSAGREGRPSVEDLAPLRQEYGFDVPSWRSQEWKVPHPLFKEWKGRSRIIDPA